MHGPGWKPTAFITIALIGGCHENGGIAPADEPYLAVPSTAQCVGSHAEAELPATVASRLASLLLADERARPVPASRARVVCVVREGTRWRLSPFSGTSDPDLAESGP